METSHLMSHNDLPTSRLGDVLERNVLKTAGRILECALGAPCRSSTLAL